MYKYPFFALRLVIIVSLGSFSNEPPLSTTGSHSYSSAAPLLSFAVAISTLLPSEDEKLQDKLTERDKSL